MFDRFKRKIERKATQLVRESSNEGRIRTWSVVVEALLFLGVITTARRYHDEDRPRDHYSNAPTEIHIHIHKDIWEE